VARIRRRSLALQANLLPMVYCVAHLTRTGSQVLAAHVVDGEAFCESCFSGNAARTVKPPLPRVTPLKVAVAPAAEPQIPASHRLTPLETKLLNVLQRMLLSESTMLAAIRRGISKSNLRATPKRKRPRQRRLRQPVAAEQPAAVGNLAASA
jgi:hypothetical protein